MASLYMVIIYYILLLLHGLDVTPIIYMILNFIILCGNQHFKIIEILPSMKGSPDEEE